ncbi:sensor histidine kinase [Streptomyces sp. PU-14G]|uniref:sensor histidine kinase n=1 Tax=Streptomyces sp. PU-14G TaxID=2800808 RepID=UPI0034DE5F62
MTTAAATAPTRVPRSWRPHRDDVLVALSGAVGGLLLWAFDLASAPLVARGPHWLALVPLAVMCLAALVRRTAQPYALLVGLLAQTADLLTGSLLATLVLFTDLLYAGVLYGSARFSRAVLRGSVAVTVLFSGWLLIAFHRAETLLLMAACAGVLLVPTTSGEMIRNHRDKAAAERQRAEQTALLAELDRKQAINAERTRMARELHDVVANHLSAIAIHSTAALSLGDAGGGKGSQDANREALGVIRENSVQGLAEMRRLIGLLRNATGADEPTATPSLDGLDALLERARAMAGDGRTFVLSDRRAPGDAPLPTPVELAAYRVVQEAVTNALKHAALGEVTVTVAPHPDPGPGGGLSLRVTSPLEERDEHGGPPRAPGAGAGLTGMRERVELLDGTLTAGPSTASGSRRVWDVHAVLPAQEETGRTPGTARGDRRNEPRETET